MWINLDVNVFRFINKTCHHAVLDLLMPLFTRLGDGIILFVVAVIMLFFPKNRVRIFGVVLLAGLTLSYYVVSLVKELIERPRPFITLEEVLVLFPDDGFSFPSNHTTMAFMAAVVLTKCFGKWYLLFPAAFLVAISRVYLGLHYPSDVFAGACTGAAIGYFLVRMTGPNDQ